MASTLPETRMDELEEAQLKGTPRGQSLGPAYSMLCAIFRAFTIILIAAGVVILVLWLAFQPRNLKVYVETVSLARFNLAPNGTLSYNLTLEMSFINPSNRVGIDYKRMEAAAFYGDGDQKFGSAAIPAFRQGLRSTAAVHMRFEGESSSASIRSMGEFERERGEGEFSVAVKIYAKARLKRVVVEGVVYMPEIDCYLKLPVATGRFTRTRCYVESFS